MIKKLFLLLAIMLAAALSAPWVVGHLLRGQLQSAVQRMPTDGQVVVELIDQRHGWLFSELHLGLHGSAVMADAQDPLRVTLQLAHGPLLWHLADSPYALAALELRATPPLAENEAQRYSASAILQLNGSRVVHFNGIAGFAAHDGDHLLQWRLQAPLSALREGWPQLLGALQGSLVIDLDAPALLDSELAELVRQYHRQRWLRFYQGRALSHISLHEGWLDINGEVVPAANALPLPAQTR